MKSSFLIAGALCFATINLAPMQAQAAGLDYWGDLLNLEFPQWYLTGAAELEGKVDAKAIVQAGKAKIDGDDTATDRLLAVLDRSVPNIQFHLR
jgi:hypothetical protein